MRRRSLPAVAATLTLLSLLVLAFPACDPATVTQPIPPTPPSPTPCQISCAPQFSSPAGSQLIATSRFTFWYYDPPWTLAAHDNNSATLTSASDYGTISAKLESSQVTSGTQASDLLDSWVQSNLSTTTYQGLSSAGTIHGAEVGYVAGVGTMYSAHLALPNAPAAPVFLDVEAATHNTTGIVVVVVSPLNPNSPNSNDRKAVHRGSYDRLVNSIRWL